MHGDPFESDDHSFHVRIWLEESGEETGRATWRGHITHVLTGTHRYFESLEEIAAFIAPYLKRMGVRLGVLWRFKEWIRRVKQF